MESKEYITNAIRTESVPESVEINQLGLGVILGLAMLSGKLVDHAKRKIYYRKAMDENQVLDLLKNISEGALNLVVAIREGADLNTRFTADELFAQGADEFDIDRLNIRLLHAGMGCFTESAELLEALGKNLAGEPLDLVNFGEEIGDIEWYQAVGFDETGVTEAHCREKNIAKLKKRYPDKFDADKANNRDLDGERAILEGKASGQ